MLLKGVFLIWFLIFSGLVFAQEKDPLAEVRAYLPASAQPAGSLHFEPGSGKEVMRYTFKTPEDYLLVKSFLEGKDVTLRERDRARLLESREAAVNQYPGAQIPAVSEGVYLRDPEFQSASGRLESGWFVTIANRRFDKDSRQWLAETEITFTRFVAGAASQEKPTPETEPASREKPAPGTEPALETKPESQTPTEPATKLVPPAPAESK